MIDTNNPPTLVKTKNGYWTFTNLPVQEDLSDYYSKKYYQDGCGSYEIAYKEEEIEYFRLKAKVIRSCIEKINPTYKKFKVLDGGCGEGWVLSEFLENGYSVKGIDFSRYGIEKINPHVLEYFQQGDIYQLLEEIISNGEKRDVIILANVIEHVLDPESLLDKISQVMHKETALAIVVPNDFSPLHNYLFEKKIIYKKFWIAFPEHLNYFNLESMTNTLENAGFTIKKIIADNPIDLNLLNQNSNYINSPDKGEKTHQYRVLSDLFLSSQNFNAFLDYSECLAKMGVGRDLTYFVTL
mgnify:CR=1 FL=1